MITSALSKLNYRVRKTFPVSLRVQPHPDHHRYTIHRLFFSLSRSSTTKLNDIKRIEYSLRHMSTTVKKSGPYPTVFPLQDMITKILSDQLQPEHLEVINESHQHNVPKGSETHFKLIIVSDKAFTGISLIQRHRLVNSLLKEAFERHGLHALSIHAKTSAEWQAIDGSVVPSPRCLGGSKA